MTARQLQAIARQHGTPVVVIDHDIIRANYAAFKRHLPKIQAYYAVKANAEAAIVRKPYKAGASCVYQDEVRERRAGASVTSLACSGHKRRRTNRFYCVGSLEV